MKVLIAHVPYQHRGGEDVHVEALSCAYQRLGVEVVFLPESRQPPGQLLKKSFASLSSSPDFSWDLLWEQQCPDFIHLHNAFPVLGPRFFRWVIHRQIPLAMTVHNHRFFCTNGLALRDGKICRDCFYSKVAWKSLLHNCNGQWSRSAYYAAALTQIHRENLLLCAVKQFIAPSPYIQGELIRWGVPAERVQHILNPIQAPEPASKHTQSFDVLYAGRLSPEKGISDLLDASRRLPQLRFAIVGGGPLQEQVEGAVRQQQNLSYLGVAGQQRVWELIAQAQVGVLPSLCNEILPTFVLEMFYQGKPCVIAEQESTAWLGLPPFPGFLARPGDGQDLARAIYEAKQKPFMSPALLDQIRNRLCFERFCDELKPLIIKMTGKSL